MTEAGWLNHSGRCHAMLVFIREAASERKLRLFACASLRRLDHLMSGGDGRAALALAEQWADGLVSGQSMAERRRELWGKTAGRPLDEALGFDAIRDDAWMGACGVVAGVDTAVCQLRPTDRRSGWWERLKSVWRGPAPDRRLSTPADEHAAQAGLLRDIFGNPFRPVTRDQAWLTSTVVALARGMYDSRDFTSLPILADALMDAGCDSDDILGHCRSEGPHVRGCWVVDLVLGKG